MPPRSRFSISSCRRWRSRSSISRMPMSCSPLRSWNPCWSIRRSAALRSPWYISSSAISSSRASASRSKPTWEPSQAEYRKAGPERRERRLRMPPRVPPLRTVAASAGPASDGGEHEGVPVGGEEHHGAQHRRHRDRPRERRRAHRVEQRADQRREDQPADGRAGDAPRGDRAGERDRAVEVGEHRRELRRDRGAERGRADEDRHRRRADERDADRDHGGQDHARPQHAPGLDALARARS